MSEYLYEIMKRASIFVILAQTIVRFRPGESYEKYLKMLVSVMTMAVLVLPIMNLFKKDLINNFQKELDGFELRMEDTLSEAYDLKELDMDNYKEALKKEIKLRLNNHLNSEGYLVKKVELTGVKEKEDAFREGESIVIYLMPAPEDKAELRKRCAGILEVEESSLEVEDGTLE